MVFSSSKPKVCAAFHTCGHSVIWNPKGWICLFFIDSFPCGAGIRTRTRWWRIWIDFGRHWSFVIKVLSNMGNFPVYYVLLNFPLLFFYHFSLEVAQWLISLNLSDIELWHHRCTLCIGICGILDFSTDVYYWDMRQMKKPWTPRQGIDPRPPMWHARTLPLSYQLMCFN